MDREVHGRRPRRAACRAQGAGSQVRGRTHRPARQGGRSHPAGGRSQNNEQVRLGPDGRQRTGRERRAAVVAALAAEGKRAPIAEVCPLLGVPRSTACALPSERLIRRSPPCRVLCPGWPSRGGEGGGREQEHSGMDGRQTSPVLRWPQSRLPSPPRPKPAPRLPAKLVSAAASDRASTPPPSGPRSPARPHSARTESSIPRSRRPVWSSFRLASASAGGRGAEKLTVMLTPGRWAILVRTLV